MKEPAVLHVSTCRVTNQPYIGTEQVGTSTASLKLHCLSTYLIPSPIGYLIA